MSEGEGPHVHVTPEGGAEYRVTVEDGESASVHHVTVAPGDLARYAPPGTTVERLLVATFRFLLEREPKESILRRFPLSVVERYFPEYAETVRERF